MVKVQITTSSVEVFKVRGATMDIAFRNLKQEHKLDNYNLTPVTSEFNEEAIDNGKIYKHSAYLYNRYLNNHISEFTVYGALYNKKPIIRDESRVLMHNIITKGTKKWETVNSYRLDSGAIIQEDTATKADSFLTAKAIAVEQNASINIVVSKRLVDMDGILGIAEFMPLDCVDKTNIYIFWVYTTKAVEADEEDVIDENTEEDTIGQLCIKEDLFGYVGRSKINKHYSYEETKTEEEG